MAIPLVAAISIQLDVPTSVNQGEQGTAEFFMVSNNIFNGVAYLSYVNTSSSVSSFVISNTSFGGGGPYD